MRKFVEKVLPGDISKLKEFTLQPGIETGTNIDLIPPPYFTPMSLPFSYNYAQNPHTKEVSPGSPDGSGSVSEDEEYGRVVNVTSRMPAAGYFIAHDEYPVPSAPRREPDMSDPQVAAIIGEMRLAMEERPIWTRRSMWNRLGARFAELPKNGGLVRHCLQYAGYQFKGGPWRDALVKYGLDPRTDPKYRVYQTLIFKLHKTRIGTVGRSWQAVRRNEIGVSNFGKAWQDLGGGDEALLNTHVFDGESFSTDGKVWQVCDITDPLLARLFANAEVRAECDVEVSGFYHRVLWSVAKAIMKCKMLAIRFGRTLTDDDFGAALETVRAPHDGGDGAGAGAGSSSSSISISLPDLQLTAAEYEQLRGGRARPRPGVKPAAGRDRWDDRRKRTHYRVRIPLKEAEEREAVKMIRLLTQGAADKRAAADAEAAAAAAAATATNAAAGGASVPEVSGTPGEGANAGAAREEREARKRDQGREQEREQEQRDGGAYQEIFDELDEEGSEEEDGSGSGSEIGEYGREAIPFKRQGRQAGIGVEQDDQDDEQEYDERGYSDEEDQEHSSEDAGEEDEDEDDEEVYDEEDYYDEEDEGFPRPWEDEDDGYDEDQYGEPYYEEE